MDKFILADDGKTPIPASLTEWATWFNNPTKRIVKRDDNVVDGVDVSTVFLGIDHSFGGDTPVLWETMIFGGPHDGYQDRYTSYDAAVAGHAKALMMAKGGE